MPNLEAVLENNSDLGQVWTPVDIAEKMANLSLRFLKENPEIILDPACGPATFQKAFKGKTTPKTHFICYDLDKKLIDYTNDILSKSHNTYQVFNEDFLSSKTQLNADIIIMNPPYIRQELIDVNKKNEYLKIIKDGLGFSADKRSNLYIYFLLKGIINLKENGIICAILYDTLSNTKYGSVAFNEIRKNCEVLHSETIQSPFHGVLVDAQIIVLRKKDKSKIISVVNDSNIIPEGFVKISKLVDCKRGIGLPIRKPFMVSDGYKHKQKTPLFFIKSKSISKPYFVSSDVIDRAYVYECESEIPPEIKKDFFEKIIELENKSQKVIKKFHKKSKADILFNYYIRNSPKHIFNIDKVLASDNFYLIEPKKLNPYAAWLLLNTDIYLNYLMDNARNQGNGLRKLQLYEYKEALVPDWNVLSKKELKKFEETALDLINNGAPEEEVKKQANIIINNTILKKYARAT